MPLTNDRYWRGTAVRDVKWLLEIATVDVAVGGVSSMIRVSRHCRVH